MEGVIEWAVFNEIFEFIDHEVQTMTFNMVNGFIKWILLTGTLIVTTWLITQGWMLVTGKSREPLASVVHTVMKVFAVTFLAAGFTWGADSLATTLGQTMPRAITGIVTANERDPKDAINESFKVMQGTFALADMFSALGDSPALKEQLKDMQLYSAVGVAGPAVVGGALLMTYKFALALFIGFGPLFILCLLFKQTQALFSKWLYYGVGTTFSLAALSFMVAIAMKVVVVVAVTMFIKLRIAATGESSLQGLDMAAIQQGGVGLVMTVLLIMCPPMAAQFFSGTVGAFTSPYSSFGMTGGRDAARKRLDTEQPGLPIDHETTKNRDSRKKFE